MRSSTRRSSSSFARSGGEIGLGRGDHVPLRLRLGAALARREDVPLPAHAGDDEEDVLEDHPEAVLDRAPHAGAGDAEHRLGPQRPPRDVIEHDRERRRHEHPSVDVEGEERERSEDEEVGLDAAACQVDEEGRHRHLADRHGVPRRREARPGAREPRGEEAGRAAQDHRREHARVHAPIQPRPGVRRDDRGERDARHPLGDQEPGEEAVGALTDVAEVLLRELRDAGVVREGRLRVAHARRRSPRSKRAAEHGRFGSAGPGVGEVREDGALAGVVPLVGAGRRDAAAEDLDAARVVEEDLPRRDGPEAPRLLARCVGEDLDARDRRGEAPQLAVGPARLGVAGLCGAARRVVGISGARARIFSSSRRDARLHEEQRGWRSMTSVGLASARWRRLAAGQREGGAAAAPGVPA